MTVAVRTINDLAAGESALIHTFIDEACAVRLLSLGVLPQTQVTLVRRSPLGDALYLRVGSHHIAIRTSEATTITLQ